MPWKATQYCLLLDEVETISLETEVTVFLMLVVFLQWQCVEWLPLLRLAILTAGPRLRWAT